jgi:hypothetical protein
VIALALGVGRHVMAEEPAAPGSNEPGEPASPEHDLLVPAQPGPAGVVAPADDPLGRDKNRMPTGADAGQRPDGFADPQGAGGNPDALVQGSGTPAGTGVIIPIRGAAALPGQTVLGLSAFVIGELAWVVYDGDEGGYDTTFRAREAEIDAEARFGDSGRMRLDLHVITEQLYAASLFSPLGSTLSDRLIEQAFVEVTPGPFTLRAGRMVAPLSYEPVDAVDRVTLSRGHLATLFAPTYLTGVHLGADLSEWVDVFVLAANGWERSVDNNKRKSLGLALPHQVAIYRGQLGFFFGDERDATSTLGSLGGATPERKSSLELLADGDTDELLGRAIVDYWGEVQLPFGLTVALEMLRGQEYGLGYDTEAQRLDPTQSAIWYGTSVWLVVDGKGTRLDTLAPWRAALRVEYLRDKDLSRHIPNAPNLPLLTTLVSPAAALRYDFAAGLSAALEYKVGFARADVAGVSVQRNGDSEDVFPRFWNLRNWFVTQEVLLALVAQL